MIVVEGSKHNANTQHWSLMLSLFQGVKKGCCIEGFFCMTEEQRDNLMGWKKIKKIQSLT